MGVIHKKEEKMRYGIIAVLIGTLLVGCASTPKPLPDNYKGPVTAIHDSQERVSGTKVYFFQLSKADGRTIKTSSWETYEYNYGKGFNMTPQLNHRFVPAKKSVLTIEGVTHYAADILAIFGSGYSISGDVVVELEENRDYYVKGKLSEDYSAVWLEDNEGNVVSEKIVKQ